MRPGPGGLECQAQASGQRHAPEGAPCQGWNRVAKGQARGRGGVRGLRSGQDGARREPEPEVHSWCLIRQADPSHSFIILITNQRRSLKQFFLQGPSARSVQTQLGQIHQSDQYCNGFGLRVSARRARPRANGSRPRSTTTKRFWNSSGRGRRRRKPRLSLPVFKNEISNKHGVRGAGPSAQLSREERRALWAWRPGGRPDSQCCCTCVRSRRGSSPCFQALPSPAGTKQTRTRCNTRLLELTAKCGPSWHEPSNYLVQYPHLTDGKTEAQRSRGFSHCQRAS